ncbi:MAG TPA: hypothetical protein VJ951_04210 [Bacteroidales bacterium]|nr:hypothetical protein [Bacteroidales bacterium]
MQSIDRKFLIEAHNDIVSTGKLLFTHELFICYFIRELKVIRYAFLKRIIGIFFILLCFHPVAKSQSAISIDGYINDMQSLYYIDEIGWLWENQLHNRINLYMYPSNWLRISLQVRNRFQQNNLYGQFPDYQNSLGTDPGLLDLTWSLHDNYNDKAGYIFTTGLDRAWAEFSAGDFVATLGRQRINWGQTMVWNPNDIFNSYSYFDVDYPERPGSDALRLQYYTGMTSNIELAAKLDSAKNITASAYYRFNALGYDIQLIAGVLQEKDLLAGIGWSGNIEGVSFRGEGSYFRNMDNFSDTTGDILFSVGLDYTFGNSIWLQSEVLYSGFAEDQDIYSLSGALSSDMSVKKLGFNTWTLFSSISYPITPLINTSLAGMYYPEWKGFFIGPSIEASIGNNLKGSLIFQGFSAKIEDPFGQEKRQNTSIGYIRLKWSF